MEDPTRRSIEELSKEELIEYQELFSLFDKEDNGTMASNHLSLFVRGMKHCPTEKQLKEIRLQLDPQDTGVIHFNDLVTLLVNRPCQTNVEDQLNEVFEALQNETGSHSDGQKSATLSVTGTKKYLTQYGETLTEAEIEEFLQFLESNGLKEGIEFNFKDTAKILAYAHLE